MATTGEQKCHYQSILHIFCKSTNRIFLLFSFSLTWTDAHLHRQLVTVLRGPVIDSFDREFRILFADSVPVPDTWGVTDSPQVYNHYQTKDFSRLRQQLSAESEITNPPPPPADVFLDWEAMGVLQRDSSWPASLLGLHKENIVEKTSQLEIDKDNPTEDRFTHNEHLVWNRRRYGSWIISLSP